MAQWSKLFFDFLVDRDPMQLAASLGQVPYSLGVHMLTHQGRRWRQANVSAQVKFRLLTLNF